MHRSLHARVSRAVVASLLSFHLVLILSRHLETVKRMSPRPRKVSDDQVFAAAQRAAMRLAPSELTLAAIAAEAGVTAGALAQRFGSKRALLLALAASTASEAGRVIRDLRATHRSPLAAVRAYADCMAELAASPAALARNLAYLQIDLADPDFRALLAVHARATRTGLEELLAAAVNADELRRGTHVRALARTVEAVLSGSLLTWAFTHEGLAAHWLRADLDAVLAPHCASPPRRPQRRRAGGRR
jgi:AcrR family transcriptional regulator